MTLAEKLRFLADRAEDGQEFYWGDVTMKFDSINVMVRKQNGEWIYSDMKVNIIEYQDIELKPQWVFTEDEKAILRNLPDEFRWIARDEDDNRLYVYTDKPTKGYQSWLFCIGNVIRLTGFPHLFKTIKRSDDEPCEFRKYL